MRFDRADQPVGEGIPGRVASGQCCRLGRSTVDVASHMPAARRAQRVGPAGSDVPPDHRLQLPPRRHPEGMARLRRASTTDDIPRERLAIRQRVRRHRRHGSRTPGHRWYFLGLGRAIDECGFDHRSSRGTRSAAPIPARPSRSIRAASARAHATSPAALMPYGGSAAYPSTRSAARRSSRIAPT